MKVTRDEVEKFLNDHADEALDSISQTPRPLSKWVAEFSKIISKVAADEGGNDEVDDEAEESVFDEGFGGGLFGDPDDI